MASVAKFLHRLSLESSLYCDARFRVMDTDPEIWTSLMWCNFLRPVESRVYEEAKDKTKVCHLSACAK